MKQPKFEPEPEPELTSERSSRGERAKRRARQLGNATRKALLYLGLVEPTPAECEAQARQSDEGERIIRAFCELERQARGHLANVVDLIRAADTIPPADGEMPSLLYGVVDDEPYASPYWKVALIRGAQPVNNDPAQLDQLVSGPAPEQAHAHYRHIVQPTRARALDETNSNISTNELFVWAKYNIDTIQALPVNNIELEVSLHPAIDKMNPAWAVVDIFARQPSLEEPLPLDQRMPKVRFIIDHRGNVAEITLQSKGTGALSDRPIQGPAPSHNLGLVLKTFAADAHATAKEFADLKGLTDVASLRKDDA